MTWDLTEKQQLVRYLIAGLIGMVILTVSAYISPSIYPLEDNLGFLRQLFNQGGLVLMRSIFAIGILLMLSFVGEGDWLEDVRKANYGPTILLSVLVYCVLGS